MFWLKRSPLKQQHQTRRAYVFILLLCILFLFALYFAFLFAFPTRNFPKSFADPETPLPSQRLDLTFYSTTRTIGSPQITAIRSWLALGADVILFVDDNITTITNLPHTLLNDGTLDPQRFKLLNTPLPRSILGAPRLDLIMESGELNAVRTNWVCMINADIVVPTEFGSVIATFADLDVFAVGERLDCRVNPVFASMPLSLNSFEDLEHWSMAPCWPHGSGGKDYFLYRKGLFQRKKLTIPPFWVGKFVWDHWLVNATREFAIDLTPSILVGHFSHEYDWNWRTVVGDREKRQEQKDTAKLDIVWNTKLIDCERKQVYDCVPFQSTYDVAYQLCPQGQIQPMVKQAQHKYVDSVNSLRLRLKPKNGEGDKMRRMYQQESLRGVSPLFWKNEMPVWAKQHGC